MAVPGLALPGLTATTTVSRTSSTIIPTVAPVRNEELRAQSELRFEIASNRIYKVRLTKGSAEIFGTELALNTTYSFSGTKLSIFTWEGCSLELQGEAESEYVGHETNAMVEWLNLHTMLDTLRQDASVNGGPRVLLVGSESCGKTSLAKCLIAWAVKVGTIPTYINLDPKESVLSVPSTLTVVTYPSQMDVEAAGWGQSSISGPTVIPPRSGLIYHFPFHSPIDNPTLYKSLTTRIALAATSKLEESPSAKSAGFIIDTPASLNRPQDSYDVISHLISEFSITVVLTMGSERLYNDVSRRHSNPANRSSDQPITVLRIPTSPGAVTRDENFFKAVRAGQLRSYFFGDPKIGLPSLNPHSLTVNFHELNIYCAIDPSASGNLSVDFLPGRDEDEDGNAEQRTAKGGDGGVGKLFEKIEPSQALLHAVLSIRFARKGAGQDEIRDSAVMGFVYVAEVDEAKKRVRFLAPHSGRWGDHVMVYGQWPEDVGDLVS